MKPYLNLAALTLILLPLSLQAQQDSLGRLFLTPEQRLMLDRHRQMNPGGTSVDDGASSLTFNGEVRRSSGRNTRWINGVAEPSSSRDKAPVTVGDTIYPGSGEKDDLLRGGRIQIRPPTAKH